MRRGAIGPRSNARTAPAVLCRVLGPIEVEIDGTAADLGGPLSRRVLAVLSTGLGNAVPDDELIERVWGDGRRGNVVQALRVIIWRLRAGLGPDGRRYLERSRSGYAFTLPVAMTDHGLLADLVARGERHLGNGETGSAVAAFAEAVALWRGDPWQDLGAAVELSGTRARMCELRDVAVEEWQAARLADGDTSTAVAALHEAVVDMPYRERRWELLAHGLYRCGRQADALAALRRARAALVADIGVEPGPILRTLEQRILAHDPDLLADPLLGSGRRMVALI
ncbi:BTAD domain-containing putative transcriptional regulator [Nocardia sp. CDC153]|uniref:AfsR/SARP family transcriptional regulator n=1 Tax=Nocardia sp. CDC153 TaxID=3112167 RepID=UPI002DBC8C4C|nr:BTAD domain-containing putative transcriptional regulator [Nocardia sp. CDC153]MEC3956973.1 BTAD domain-containing putative transcriptional regulator [Nocardia sp. CDC153]